MNSTLMKHSCNKIGANYLKYIMSPTQLVPVTIFNCKKKIQVNHNSAHQIYYCLSDFLVNQNVRFTCFSSHLYFLVKNGNLDYNNLIIDIYVFIDKIKDILVLYELFQNKFKNVVLYSELGLIFIVPDYIGDSNDNSIYPIIVVTFLMQNNYIHSDSNVFNLEKPYSDETITYKNTIISSDYEEFIKKNYDDFSKIKNKICTENFTKSLLSLYVLF